MAAEFPKHPFLLPPDEVAQALGTDVDKGLTSAQVAELQKKYSRLRAEITARRPENHRSDTFKDIPPQPVTNNQGH